VIFYSLPAAYRFGGNFPAVSDESFPKKLPVKAQKKRN
jgi:hypothetical protein